MKKYLVEVLVSLFIVLSLIMFFATQGNSSKPAPLDSQYINSMRSYDNEYLNAISDEALLAIAKDICSDFMYGYNLDEVIKLRMQDDSEESRLIFGYVLLNGTKAFCPDYQYYIEELTW